MPVIQDLASANLQFKHDCIMNLHMSVDQSFSLSLPTTKAHWILCCPRVHCHWTVCHFLSSQRCDRSCISGTTSHWKSGQKTSKRSIMMIKVQNRFSIFRTFIASCKRKVCLMWMLLPMQLVQWYMSNQRDWCQTKQPEGTARHHHLCSTSTPGMYHNITPIYVNSHHIIGPSPSTTIIQ